MRAAKKVTIRSYLPGDERDIVRLFHQTYGSFTGPTKVTPARWREMHERGWWNRPSVVEDPECARILVRRGQVLGYLVFHQRTPKDGHAYLQELCIADAPDCEGLARLLIEDAVRVLRRRGVDTVTWMQSPTDPFATGLADDLAFLKLLREPTVFMARVVSLDAVLGELAPAFARRLKASDFTNWSGTILFEVDNQQAALKVAPGSVTLAARPPARPTLTVRTDQGTLCRLALGALRAEEAYQQDWLSLRPIRLTLADGTRRALELLDVVFPENRWTLPRAHSW